MATVKSTSVNSLMTKAQQALSRNHWFEAERLCARALDMARAECDFNLMARVLLPLQEARRQRMVAMGVFIPASPTKRHWPSSTQSAPARRPCHRSGAAAVPCKCRSPA